MPDYTKLPEAVRLQIAKDNLENAINNIGQMLNLSVPQIALVAEGTLASVRGALMSYTAAQQAEAVSAEGTGE